VNARAPSGAYARARARARGTKVDRNGCGARYRANVAAVSRAFRFINRGREIAARPSAVRIHNRAVATLSERAAAFPSIDCHGASFCSAWTYTRRVRAISADRGYLREFFSSPPTRGRYRSPPIQRITNSYIFRISSKNSDRTCSEFSARAGHYIVRHPDMRYASVIAQPETDHRWTATLNQSRSLFLSHAHVPRIKKRKKEKKKKRKKGKKKNI